METKTTTDALKKPLLANKKDEEPIFIPDEADDGGHGAAGDATPFVYNSTGL